MSLIRQVIRQKKLQLIRTTRIGHTSFISQGFSPKKSTHVINQQLLRHVGTPFDIIKQQSQTMAETQESV